MLTTEKIYCQLCLARNSSGEEYCSRCGMRLMLISRPAALRFEEEELAARDEYLLARLSVLESRVEALSKEVARLRAELSALLTKRS